MFNCKTFLCYALVGSKLLMHGEVDRNQVGFEINSKIYLASSFYFGKICSLSTFASVNLGYLGPTAEDFSFLCDSQCHQSPNNMLVISMAILKVLTLTS
jgi:hypothetical protein